MEVHIDQINIENAGPIVDKQIKLGPINLIYGLNERGKTILVEFVIRSLFKNLSGWDLREIESQGKIVVAGLKERPLSFMPSSSKKLEHYLSLLDAGLPERISRLLVVKGADLSFDDASKTSISRNRLKDFLSGQGVLDEIQGQISKTVRDAQFKNSLIDGKKMGEIRHRKGFEDDLERLDGLFDEIEKKYSGAERQALKERVQELETAIADQELARRQHAFLIDQEIQNLKAERNKIPQENLDNLASDFKMMQETQKRLKRKQDQFDSLSRESENYVWLDGAIGDYETKRAQDKAKVSPIYPIVILVALFLAIVSGVIYFPLMPIFIIIALIFGWLYVRQYQKAADQAVDILEIEMLGAEFPNRFDEPFSGLPQMKEKKRAMDRAYHGLDTLSDDIKVEQERLAELQDQIVITIQSIAGQVTSQEDWESDIQKLKHQRDRLEDEIKQKEVDLAALGIAPVDYFEESCDVLYSQIRLNELQEEMQQVSSELEDKTAELEILKQQISKETKDEITTEWETLIQKLQQKREEIAAAYRRVTAKIVAGILVDDQLEIIRKQVEENIQEKLSSPLVGQPLFQITNRYTDVSYSDGNLFFVYDNGEFELGDLSTGAREQALLGLRLGIASHLFQKERLFLLLDDAFQHADWERRERLVNVVVNLAKDGWQITYFTMDDHIRDLFNAAGREHFPDQYMYYELGAG